MAKKQRVRFHKGDQRPSKLEGKLSYTKEMVKKGRKIIWQVWENPTEKCIAEFFFEEDAHRIVKLQNKYRVWQENGGIPNFLHIKI